MATQLATLNNEDKSYAQAFCVRTDAELQRKIKVVSRILNDLNDYEKLLKIATDQYAKAVWGEDEELKEQITESLINLTTKVNTLTECLCLITGIV